MTQTNQNQSSTFRFKEYIRQARLSHEALKALDDIPNYHKAEGSETCANCALFKAGNCVKYKAKVKASYTCDEWKGESVITEKHLQGKHNQLSHGFRINSTPSLDKARQYRKEGILQDYLSRARKPLFNPLTGQAGKANNPQEARKLVYGIERKRLDLDKSMSDYFSKERTPEEGKRDFKKIYEPYLRERKNLLKQRNDIMDRFSKDDSDFDFIQNGLYDADSDSRDGTPFEWRYSQPTYSGTEFRAGGVRADKWPFNYIPKQKQYSQKEVSPTPSTVMGHGTGGLFSDPALETSKKKKKQMVSAKEVSLTPPESAKNAAKRALAWRDKYGNQVKAMTPVGWTRARQLANGKPLSMDTVKRMAQFNRHRKNADVNPKYKDEPWRDNGYVAWLGWGGTSGIDWAIAQVNKAKREQESTKEAKLDNQGRDMTTKESKPMKKEADGLHPATHYLVVENPNEVSTWHLQVYDKDGKLDRRLMGAAKAALTVGYRGNKYQGPDKQKALDKLAKLYKSLDVDMPVSETIKHLQGKHNQLTHGFRLGATPSLAKARQYREAGLLQDYLGRSRDRQGTKPSKTRQGEKPKQSSAETEAKRKAESDKVEIDKATDVLNIYTKRYPPRWDLTQSDPARVALSKIENDPNMARNINEAVTFLRSQNKGGEDFVFGQSDLIRDALNRTRFGEDNFLKRTNEFIDDSNRKINYFKSQISALQERPRLRKADIANLESLNRAMEDRYSSLEFNTKERDLYNKMFGSSTTKSITTKPGHNHGRSIKNPLVYEALLKKGMPKGMAAAISNAQEKGTVAKKEIVTVTKAKKVVQPVTNPAPASNQPNQTKTPMPVQTPNTPTTQSASNPLHIAVGNSLGQFGVVSTLDAFGEGPEPHGSAWKAPIASLPSIQAALLKAGYKQSGGKFRKNTVLIDTGKDKKTFYLYITDNEGVAKRAKELLKIYTYRIG